LRELNVHGSGVAFLQLHCPALELIQQMQVYQKNYHKYEGNIEESCRASASHYVALRQLYARIVDNITSSCGYQHHQSIMHFRVVQVIKSLQDPLEVGNNLPGINDNVRE